MKKIYIIFKISISLLLLTSNFSCTNLNETVYSELNKDNFYKNKNEVLQAANRPVTHMQAWLLQGSGNGERNYFYYSELSADQLAWPQKGMHGYDSGDHIRLHYHTWTADESRMRNTWSLMWTGVGYTNAAIEDLSAIDYSAFMTDEEMDMILSELKVLRAFHYLKLMDLWGNIPIVTEVGKPLNPPTRPRAEVFEFVKTELETYVPRLQAYSSSMIGRLTQTGGYAMLAELYLNAEQWIGTPMYDKAVAACDYIINGNAGGLKNGKPDLETDINSAFNNNNKNNSEALYQYAYSATAGFAFEWNGCFNGYSNTSAIGDWTYSGNNAMVVIPSAFDMYDEKDLRKKEWFLFGPQYKYETDIPVLGTEEYLGKPLVYVNNIRRNSEGATGEGGMTQGEENSGARHNKYKSGPQTDPNYRETQAMIYRLTEIYFIKAEALMRLNGGIATQEVVDLINTSRKRSFDPTDWDNFKYTTATLTMDEFLAEKGREFIFEGKRRTDLIRFGKFTTASWWDHKPSGKKYLELFPIPNIQLGANMNLVQNEGY